MREPQGEFTLFVTLWGHDVPEAVFMVKELQDGALAQMKGVARYQPKFDAV